jgi:hypothetical protein
MKKSDVFAEKMSQARIAKEGSFREVSNDNAVKQFPQVESH